MPTIERSHTRRRHRPVPPTRSSIFRTSAALCVTMVLGTAAFQTAFAGHKPGHGVPPGQVRKYESKHNGSSWSRYLVGGFVAAGTGYVIFRGLVSDDDEDEPRPARRIATPTGDAAAAPQLPADAGQLKTIRITGLDAAVEPGRSRVLDLQVYSKDSKQWHSVLHNEHSSLEVAKVSPNLVKQDGTKNVFCVPLTAEVPGSGTHVTVVGRYAPPDGKPLTVNHRVQISAPAVR